MSFSGALGEYFFKGEQIDAHNQGILLGTTYFCLDILFHSLLEEKEVLKILSHIVIITAVILLCGAVQEFLQKKVPQIVRENMFSSKCM